MSRKVLAPERLQISAVECGKLAVSSRAKKELCSFFGVEAGELFDSNGLAV
jgi:hypothetical protein